MWRAGCGRDRRELRAVSDGDRRRWDERYATVGLADPAPPQPLRGREDLLPGSGRALDVACGRGAAAVWLAERGLTVDAVDVSPAGLAAAAELAAARGVTGVRWWQHDLDTGLPPECRGRYDVVVCERFRDPTLYPALAAALAPGGLLAVTVLSQVGGSAGEFRAPPGELRSAFGGLTVLHHAEADGLASLLATRP